MANEVKYTTIKIPATMAEELYALMQSKEYMWDNFSELIRKMIRLGLDQVQERKK